MSKKTGRAKPKKQSAPPEKNSSAEKKSAARAPSTSPTAEQTPPPAENPQDEKTPKHLQCPICFEGYGGKGKRRWQRRVSGRQVRRCYSCEECGHNWTVDVTTRDVEMTMQTKDHEIDPNIIEDQ